MTFRDQMRSGTRQIFKGIGSLASYTDDQTSKPDILVILRRGMQSQGDITKGVGPLDYVSIQNEDVSLQKKGGIVEFSDPTIGRFRLVQKIKKNDFYQKWEVQEEK